MMMYGNKLAIAVKSHGRVLREFKDTVYLPFNSEYSLYIKNLNSVRAQVKISIDGKDVGNGTSFVVNANSSINIERFVKDKNVGNKFKFIEFTNKIEKHRGVDIEDGLIRVEYQFEKIYTYTYSTSHWPNIWYGPYYYGGPVYTNTTYTSNTSGGIASNGIGMFDSGAIGSATSSATSSGTGTGQITATPVGTTTGDVTASSVNFANETGITVPGSISNQKFGTVSGFPLEDEKHVLVLRMLGQTAENMVKEPITVNKKQKCITCGTVNKITSKFCAHCGTALEVIV